MLILFLDYKYFLNQSQHIFINQTHSDMDVEAIQEAAATGVVVTYEDHNVKTGLGSLVANVLAEQGLHPRFRKLGIASYGSSGKPDELFKAQGLDVDSLVRVVKEEIGLK